MSLLKCVTIILFQLSFVKPNAKINTNDYKCKNLPTIWEQEMR